ncbi:uncharacterized protein C8A04DRAFT_32081 [Dichotomopilus funicola]|uniref:Uncharacterized protein n=1 Tax=Dichotomopilus funicola TaxID=1934379 RepID=A0AAN6ZJR6_9PEZI|nr:hypothetical protein C8A04DRAFT_32081 [Dichotomopilus funicola]
MSEASYSTFTTYEQTEYEIENIGLNSFHLFTRPISGDLPIERTGWTRFVQPSRRTRRRRELVQPVRNLFLPIDRRTPAEFKKQPLLRSEQLVRYANILSNAADMPRHITARVWQYLRNRRAGDANTTPRSTLPKPPHPNPLEALPRSFRHHICRNSTPVRIPPPMMMTPIMPLGSLNNTPVPSRFGSGSRDGYSFTDTSVDGDVDVDVDGSGNRRDVGTPTHTHFAGSGMHLRSGLNNMRRSNDMQKENKLLSQGKDNKIKNNKIQKTQWDGVKDKGKRNLDDRIIAKVIPSSSSNNSNSTIRYARQNTYAPSSAYSGHHHHDRDHGHDHRSMAMVKDWVDRTNAYDRYEENRHNNNNNNNNNNNHHENSPVLDQRYIVWYNGDGSLAHSPSPDTMSLTSAGAYSNPLTDAPSPMSTTSDPYYDGAGAVTRVVSSDDEGRALGPVRNDVHVQRQDRRQIQQRELAGFLLEPPEAYNNTNNPLALGPVRKYVDGQQEQHQNHQQKPRSVLNQGWQPAGFLTEQPAGNNTDNALSLGPVRHDVDAQQHHQQQQHQIQQQQPVGLLAAAPLASNNPNNPYNPNPDNNPYNSNPYNSPPASPARSTFRFPSNKNNHPRDPLASPFAPPLNTQSVFNGRPWGPDSPGWVPPGQDFAARSERWRKAVREAEEEEEERKRNTRWNVQPEVKYREDWREVFGIAAPKEGRTSAGGGGSDGGSDASTVKVGGGDTGGISTEVSAAEGLNELFGGTETEEQRGSAAGGGGGDGELAVAVRRAGELVSAARGAVAGEKGEGEKAVQVRDANTAESSAVTVRRRASQAQVQLHSPPHSPSRSPPRTQLQVRPKLQVEIRPQSQTQLQEQPQSQPDSQTQLQVRPQLQVQSQGGIRRCLGQRTWICN